MSVPCVFSKRGTARRDTFGNQRIIGRSRLLGKVFAGRSAVCISYFFQRLKDDKNARHILHQKRVWLAERGSKFLAHFPAERIYTTMNV